MTNRLAAEKSPYLLQHANNPVDWYPWGDEAFDRARAEDKPIFLSIGYSTCHWCHVMERESFENAEIAALLNQAYVSVKVDREERPDVDRVYMSTVQALTGAGGWPLSVWLTPDRVPYYGGTYFPSDSRYGRPGFPQVLGELARVWREERDKVLDSGQRIVESLTRAAAGGGESGATLEESWLADGYRQLASSWDQELGGFGEAPKFPRPAVFNFLLRYHHRTGDVSARDMVVDSLRKMCDGGVYDHLGGGLHRYSVDRYWRVPHFEKMLYDQSQLVVSLLEAYQFSGDETLARVATEVLDYVARDMTAPDGGLFSAQDADSARDAARPDEKVEGAFYMWELDEVAELLGPAEAEIFAAAYGLSSAGNTMNDPHEEFGTANVLYRAIDPDRLAEEHGRDSGEIEALLARGRAALLERRTGRPHPYLDDKILAAWNGGMVGAFARAYQVLGRRQDLDAARRAALFVRAELWSADDGLKRRYRDGEARFAGQLEDYAQLVQGLLELWEADFDPEWLDWACELQERSLELFSDPAGGAGAARRALFDAVEDPSVLVRSRELYDGAEPSGNSISAINLIRLAWLLDRPEWRARAEEIVRAAAGHLSRCPHAVPQMLVALDALVGNPSQVVITGALDDAAGEALLDVVRRHFDPHRVVLRVGTDRGEAAVLARMSWLAELASHGGESAAHVCRDYACALPTSDPQVLASTLESGTRS